MMGRTMFETIWLLLKSYAVVIALLLSGAILAVLALIGRERRIAFWRSLSLRAAQLRQRMQPGPSGPTDSTPRRPIWEPILWCLAIGITVSLNPNLPFVPWGYQPLIFVVLGACLYSSIWDSERSRRTRAVRLSVLCLVSLYLVSIFGMILFMGLMMRGLQG
jgi:hypothetical protein